MRVSDYAKLILAPTKAEAVMTSSFDMRAFMVIIKNKHEYTFILLD